MKLTRKTFVANVTILLLLTSTILSNNLLKENVQSKDYNSGSWKLGYKCPFFEVGKDTGAKVEQGAILIKAIDIVNNAAENKKGFLFEFEKAPAADALILKFAVKLGAKKFYIPWRFIQSDIAYNNPYFGYKTLIGTVVTDTKENYSYTIKLPYAYTTYYISDDEAEKLKVAMDRFSTTAQQNIKRAKAILNDKFAEFVKAKEDIKDTQENNTPDKLKLEIKKKEEQMGKECEKNTLIKKQIIDATKVRDKLLGEFLSAKNDLLEANKALNGSNYKLDVMKKNVEEFKKNVDASEQILENKKKADKALIDADKEFKILKENAPDKAADIEKSKIALKALNMKDYQDNLNKIKP